MPRDNTRIKKRRVLSPSAASRGQCTIKDFSTRICRYPVARSLPRKNPFPSERIRRGNRDREAKERGRRGKGADGRQTEPSRYREGGRRIDAKGEEKKKSGKMGSQLFFRLACCVPLAITRLERNIFSGLFPASLISNYESETTRWAAASGSPLPSTRRSLHPPSSNGPFFVFSSLIQRLAQAVTCLDSPFFYPAPAVLPRENSSLRYFCSDLTFPQFSISRPIPLFPFNSARGIARVMYL